MSDAVRAVRKALHEGRDGVTACGSPYAWDKCPTCLWLAEAAVETASPIIEAEVRAGAATMLTQMRQDATRAADNGEPELDDQISITGQYPPTGDTVWPPADNEEPE